MSEQNPQTDRWTFPFDSTEGATQQTPPEKTERGRRLAAALPAIGAREAWKAPLPSQAPPPTSVGLGATHGAFALKAFIAGLSIPAAVFAGVRLGAAPPPATPPLLPSQSIEVQVDKNTDGRFWGLPPGDRVRLPRPDNDR